ncbi:Hypothetical_protein [Hexamita inflata]|uniref:Hypothetical_protein n=1 Tax=Hexamita inflata TaxID=28002 RepID=A0AA86R5J8_9EUKA|nr:Hypothetical protein HINF_LOCUS53977 [Hexamita inflata]
MEDQKQTRDIDIETKLQVQSINKNALMLYLQTMLVKYTRKIRPINLNETSTHLTFIYTCMVYVSSAYLHGHILRVGEAASYTVDEFTFKERLYNTQLDQILLIGDFGWYSTQMSITSSKSQHTYSLQVFRINIFPMVSSRLLQKSAYKRGRFSFIRGVPLQKSSQPPYK